MRHCPVTTLGILSLKGLPNLYRNIVNSWLKKLLIRIFESLTSDKEEFQLDMKKKIVSIITDGTPAMLKIWIYWNFQIRE